MKTKRFCKSTVSMILALIMLVSMCTVAFVNTAAAEADVAQTGATQRIYFQNNWNWSNVSAYCWNSSTNSNNKDWPGVAMTEYDGGTVKGGYDVYYYEFDASKFDRVIFNGLKDDNSGNRDQSPNIESIDYDKVYYMAWDNGNQIKTANLTDILPDEGGSTDPTEPDDPTEFTQICFRDDASEAVDTADADMYVQFNGGDKTKMTKTVDTMSGHDMWYADIPEGSTSVKFIRTSVIDKAEWNTWSPTLSGCTTGLYRATGWGEGSWGTSSEYFAIPNKKDINDYSFGIWADTRNNGNLYDLSIARKVSSSEFHLYLPSNTPDSVKLYTSFASLNIGGVDVVDGQEVYLPYESANYTITFKQTEYDTSEKTATLKVYRTTDTATLMFQTKRDLFTGTVGTLDVSGYKDAIETKGNYYIYGEDGTWENAPVTEDDGTQTDMSVLKKIKGRGNSSFEASMRLYGKYAYNFNLDEKIKLIDGSTASKKWCLLANNPDVTMLRNTFVYQLADEIGVKYAPETRLVDVYDNGYYLGAYVITEKVEYGKNTMMAKDSLGNKINNLDDGNEEANIEEYGYYDGNEDGVIDDKDKDKEYYVFDFDNLVYDTDTITVGGKSYEYQYTKSDKDGHTFVSPENYNTEYNYLLEHELSSRFKNEASWFLTPKGQPVVVKYPEFATKEEMEWIITEYATMEQAVYNDDYATYSKLIDVDSFAKMYLIQELSMNLDSCATSYYIHNEFDANGKSILFASPVWDYDWAFGAYAKDLKYIYNGSSVTTSVNMSSPNTQMFVKKKAIQTDSSSSNGVTWEANYNLQAKLAQNKDFWTECQRIWTNDMVDVLYSYIKDDSTDEGIIIDEYLPQFTSAVNMNNARWGSYTYTGDDWGTKVTTDYTPYSYDFKVGNTGTSGSSSKSYSNAVYYLNDWLKTRRDYMSSSTGGGLYDKTLLDPFELKSVTMDATQSGNTVTVNVTIDATNNGVQIADANKIYELFVNGESKGKYSVTEAATVTLEENVETKIYVVGYLTDDDTKSMESDSQKFTYTVTGPEYKVESVKFEAVQSADEATVTVTPSAVVTLGGEAVSNDKINYTVYLNGSAYGTYTFDEKPSVDVNLAEGIVNEIYIVVAPVDSTVKGTSTTEKFSYNVEVEKVNATLYFKASSSARYIPTVIVDGVTTSMTISGDYIGANATKTQKYYWYTATVEVAKDVATRLTFKNNYSMNATTTVTLSADATFYFGVDNMNNGTAVVDLTAFDENIRNFTKSATHMVTNDPTEAGVATTSIDGTIYKMGDADVDNTVSVLDATTIQLALAGKTELSDTASDISDFDLDQTTSIMDATNVQVYLASGN